MPNIAARRLFVACAFACSRTTSGCGGGGGPGAPPPPRHCRPDAGPEFRSERDSPDDDVAFYSNAILLQSDGKIVAPEPLSGDPANVATGIALVAMTLTAHWTRFGRGHRKHADRIGNRCVPPDASNPGSAALQSDGKILVLGYSGRRVLARFNPDGTLDGNFGAAGRI
jgi:hypothetical protein